MIRGDGRDRGADREVLDHVRVPTVASLLQLDRDDAFGFEPLRLGLHPLHRELPCVVQRLREVRHLGVPSDAPKPAAEALMCDVVDARPHHEPERPVAGREQREEILAREIARERPAVRRTVQNSLAVAHGGADRDELGEITAPLVPADVEPYADDPIGAELVRLLLHARHRQLARVVHRLSQDVHLLVPAPLAHLKADVIDRRADDEAERLEPGGADEQKLVDGEIAREEAALPHALQTLAAVLRNAGGGTGLVLLLLLIRHCASSVSGSAVNTGGSSPVLWISMTAVASTCSVTIASTRFEPPPWSTSCSR